MIRVSFPGMNTKWRGTTPPKGTATIYQDSEPNQNRVPAGFCPPSPDWGEATWTARDMTSVPFVYPDSCSGSGAP